MQTRNLENDKIARKRYQQANSLRNALALPVGNKTCKRCGQRKPFNQFHVLLADKNGRQTLCKICTALQAAANTDRNRPRLAAWYAKDKVRIAALRKAKRIADPEHARTLAKKSKLANPITYAASHRNSIAKRAAYYAACKQAWAKARPLRGQAKAKRWRDANTDKCRAQNARYCASRINATPAWADTVLILAFYKQADALNKQHGKGTHHVDHIVPLRSRWVCGLHTHHNLEVLSCADNCRKGNRKWPDMFVVKG